jgi:predicted transcriptional regulator
MLRYYMSGKVEIMPDRTILVQVREGLAERLDHLTHKTGRSTSFHVQQAIEEMLALQEWQLQAIGEGIAAVERGDVVDHETAITALRRWGTRAN